MNVLVNNPVQSTILFSIILALVIIVSSRWRKQDAGLSIEASQELKGIAILMVVLSHIGYFLVSDTRFLFPLSVAAGVGVNLFLFLSGFGLTISSKKSTATVWQNYTRRLSKLFVPMWIVLAILLILDYFFLGKTYSLDYIFKAIIGLFTSADLYHDINSPLWYFTLIVFYYLLFPLVFSKKRPWLSAMVIYLISFFIIRSEPAILENVIRLHKIHLVAFPLGMIFSYFLSKDLLIIFFKKIFEKRKTYLRWLILVSSLFVFIYSIKNSNIGIKNLEEVTSLISVLALVLIFSIKKINFKVLYWVGFFSYEIYLIHWPIMHRYDFIYKYLPPWLATIIYLLLFIAFSWGLQKLANLITKKNKAREIKKTD